MATVKARLMRLEERVGGLRVSGCSSCRGVGHPRRFVLPWIGDKGGGRLWGEKQLVSDDRIDGDGSCVACGVPAMGPSIVDLALSPDLERLRLRVLD
jgi:hypothetical protein